MKGDALRHCWQDPKWRGQKLEQMQSPEFNAHRIACLLRSKRARDTAAKKHRNAQAKNSHLVESLREMTKRHDEMLAALCQLYVIDRQNKFVAGKLEPEALGKVEFMLRQRIHAQDKRITALEDELEALRDGLGIGARQVDPLQRLGLTAQQARLVGLLLSREFVTREQGLFACAVDQEREYASPKLVDVIVCKIRPKIRPFGATIETQWGEGWFMTAESKSNLKAAMSRFSTRAAE